MFDADRVEKALRDEGKRKGINKNEIDRAVHSAMHIVERCGEFSQNRKMATRIGSALMNGCKSVVVPVCVNYRNLENCDGATTLFLERHISFLESIGACSFALAPTFLVPRHEATSDVLNRWYRISEDSLTKVFQGIYTTARTLSEKHGWNVCSMDILIPDIVEREQEAYVALSSDTSIERQINAHMLRRRALYSERMQVEEMRSLTVRTAAQYVAFGNFAAKNNLIICNHTTTSLQWYTRTGAAVLHNPISLG